MSETTADLAVAEDLNDLQRPLREMHRRFHALVEPLRPDLYRYCLRLSGNPFDAEDLVQETLTRAFGRLYQFYQPVETRQYVFRIATNLWIDQCRRAQRLAFEPLDEEWLLEDDQGETDHDLREAVRVLVDLLEPRQRVALLLKDAFDFPIAAIAEFLETTPGAVKALLHRGRARLANEHSQPPHSAADAAHRRLVEAYTERFSAQDWDGVAALLRADATLVVTGIDEEHGLDFIRRSALAETAKDNLPGHRAEVAVLDGEPVMLWLFRPDDGPEAVRDVFRFRSDGQALTHVQEYWFCPDVVREVAQRLGRRAEPAGDYVC